MELYYYMYIHTGVYLSQDVLVNQPHCDCWLCQCHWRSCVVRTLNNST